MEVIALVILVLSILTGLAAIFFTTFGTLIILIGSVLYAAMTNFSVVSWQQLVLLLTLYLIGEVFEYLFIIIGAKKFGASNWAVAGALIGGIVGAVLGAGALGIGLIGGAFLGIFLGAFLVEYLIHQDVVKSLKAGAGGVLGRMGSIVAKLIIATVMIGIMATNIIHFSF